jgi:hypothetical protein
MMPQLVQTMRGPKAGTGASSGQASTFSTASWWQRSQTTHSERTPLRPHVGERHGRAAVRLLARTGAVFSRWLPAAHDQASSSRLPNFQPRRHWKG